MSVALVAAAFGFAQGARHALEPDHLAAVSTLAQDRPGARHGLVLGAAWGIGHTLSLSLVGGTLAATEAVLPPSLAAVFELLVAVMLVALGGRAILRSLEEGRSGPRLTHRHGGLAHVHTAPGAHLHAGTRTLATRPLLIGVVHGLAGSGALSALVMAHLRDAPTRLLFIALFGLGSILAMAAMSALVGSPLLRLQRTPAWAGRLLMMVGVTSVGLGLFWGVVAIAAV